MTAIWIGIALVIVGLAMIFFGARRSSTNTMTVHGSSGTFIQGTKGDVNIGGAAAGPSKPSGEERFLKWGGFVVAILGLIVAAAKFFTG